MGKEPVGRGRSDELAAIGELLAALTQALVAGKPEEITALARLIEERAGSLVATEVDPARLAALAALRERAALLVQTLFSTTDQFLVRALEVQTRSRGYRPGRSGLPLVERAGDTTTLFAGHGNGFAEFRA